MSTKIYANARFGFREDALENWIANNPVLERGEPAVVRDGENGEWLKIGDGVTSFNSLPWKKVSGDISSIIDNIYKPDSSNAQSGIAIDGAVAGRKTGSGGEIFNDYENNKAISPYSTAKGTNTVAGGKGFKVLSVATVPNTEGVACKIRLDSVEGLETGMVCSATMGNHYTDFAKIVSVDTENNIIALDTCPEGFTINGESVLWVSTFVAQKSGIGTTVIGAYQSAEGHETVAIHESAHAEGSQTVANGKYSHAEGRKTKAGYAAHAEGYGTQALGNNSHAEGQDTKATGLESHAEGWATNASGRGAHSEGSHTSASNVAAHAEGYSTKATGQYSHAEGHESKASGMNAHAEGQGCEATGKNSHAQGHYTRATATNAFTAGSQTTALHENSTAFGKQTVTGTEGQTVVGEYNEQVNAAHFVVGNGYVNTVTNKPVRKNAFVVKRDGSALLQAMGTADNAVAIKAYVDNEIATFDFIKIVQALPEIGLPNRFYLVPSVTVGEQDLFDEYIWVNNTWEFVASKKVEVDLTKYATVTDVSLLDERVSADIHALSQHYVVAHYTKETTATKDNITYTFTWECRKWNNGFVECWGVLNIPIKCDKLFNEVFYTDAAIWINLPECFYGVPNVSLNPVNTTGSNFMIANIHQVSSEQVVYKPACTGFMSDAVTTSAIHLTVTGFQGVPNVEKDGVL